MSDIAISTATLFCWPIAARSPVSATRSPIVIVPESPEETEVIEVDGVTGGNMLGAAAYITTSPINRPMTNADVAATLVFISLFPPTVSGCPRKRI